MVIRADSRVELHGAELQDNYNRPGPYNTAHQVDSYELPGASVVGADGHNVLVGSEDS